MRFGMRVSAETASETQAVAEKLCLLSVSYVCVVCLLLLLLLLLQCHPVMTP
jgi:hypothetical protein